MDITEDPRVQEFLSNRELSHRTVERYLVTLQHYSKATGLSLTDLIQQAEDEEDEGIRKRSRSIKKHFLEFKKYVEDKDFSDTNISTSFAIVRTFYNEYEIDLPNVKIATPHTEETIDSLPNKDNINYALQHVNLKYRAIILLMVSSGMGTSEIISLRYGDFLKSVETYVKGSVDIDVIADKLASLHSAERIIVGTWYIQRVKTKNHYYTFSTYESIDAIIQYLKKEPPTDVNDYLFRATKKYGGQMRRKTFTNYFTELNKKCGFGIPHRQIFFRSHNLRKYFASTLFKNKIPKLVVDWMLGHRIDSTSNAYFKADIPSLQNQYIDCIPDLTMADVDVITIKSDEVLKMEEEIKEIKEELEFIKGLREQTQSSSR